MVTPSTLIGMALVVSCLQLPLFAQKDSDADRKEARRIEKELLAQPLNMVLDVEPKAASAKIIELAPGYGYHLNDESDRILTFEDTSGVSSPAAVAVGERIGQALGGSERIVDRTVLVVFRIMGKEKQTRVSASIIVRSTTSSGAIRQYQDHSRESRLRLARLLKQLQESSKGVPI